jgi:hypothetical protein
VVFAGATPRLGEINLYCATVVGQIIKEKANETRRATPGMKDDRRGVGNLALMLAASLTLVLVAVVLPCQAQKLSTSLHFLNLSSRPLD